MSGENQLFKSGKTIRLRWDFCRSRISAWFGKTAGFRLEPEPKSGTALVWGLYYQTSAELCPRYFFVLELGSSQIATTEWNHL